LMPMTGGMQYFGKSFKRGGCKKSAGIWESLEREGQSLVPLQSLQTQGPARKVEDRHEELQWGVCTKMGRRGGKRSKGGEASAERKGGI